MNPSHLPPPHSTAYAFVKEEALARALQLRREAIDDFAHAAGGALQRLASLWQEPWNWRKVRGSIASASRHSPRRA